MSKFMAFVAGLRRRWNGPQGYGGILGVGLPLAAGMASSTVMQFTDRYFLSHFSVEAVAAVMPASLASLTVLFTLSGLTGYTAVLTAQYLGAGAPRRIGPAVWQGIWCALLGGLLLLAFWWLARPLFACMGHDAHIQALETDYFRVIVLGAEFPLLGAALGGFFAGRGQTRPVMLANIAAALVNIPLDYLLIFGGFGLPSLGVTGAALATAVGWAVECAILIPLVFTRANDARFQVIRGWRFEGEMFRRLLRFGLPSGCNFCLELIAVTWFAMEIGAFGAIPLAASNIAFSVNSLIFMPAMGLNMAVSTLVGQAMGRRDPAGAELVVKNALHLALAYILPLTLVIALFAPEIMDLFRPGDLKSAAYAPVRECGVIFLYCIAFYSLVDSANIIYFGALKGAGDTLGVFMLLGAGAVLLLFLPVAILKFLNLDTVYSLWGAFTLYVVLLAGGAALRFSRRKWRRIRMLEAA
ncbi:MAG: MATE family efflux transporter [Deltaproteobacteria bacterium]|jgi:MATE family multidrug resistance protein|nr:MATE family efflux transporter [Deltaproteobacteria bacterium]